jgi:hypothetical protein
MAKFNMNQWLGLPTGGHEEERRIVNDWALDRKTPVRSEGLSLYFDNLENVVCDEIKASTVAVGCLAWLTNQNILKALAEKERVGIAIQKEDFLRPDSGSWSAKKLHDLYTQLPAGPGSWVLDEFRWGGLLDDLSTGGEWRLDPVRWAGEFNNAKSPAFPRMHHKFLVLCKLCAAELSFDEDEGWVNDQPDSVIPYRVLTGSFNYTANACYSMENIIAIDDPKVVEGYYREWQRVYLAAERIPDYAWNREWEADYLRVGT